MSADIPYVTDSDYRTPLPQNDTERQLWQLVIELYRQTYVESTPSVDSHAATQQSLPGQPSDSTVHPALHLVPAPQPLEEAERQVSSVTQELPSRREPAADEASHDNGITVPSAPVMRPGAAPSSRAVATPPQDLRREVQPVSLAMACRPPSRLPAQRTMSRGGGAGMDVAGGSPERDKYAATSIVAALPALQPAREELQLWLRPLSERLCALTRRRHRVGASVLDVAIQHPHTLLRRELVRLLLSYPYWCFDACAPVVVAAAMGDVPVIEQLLQDHRLDPNTCAPLRTAVCHGQVAVLQVLLAHPRIVPNHGGAFLTAVARGDTAAMALFEAHADFDINRTVHPTGCTALVYVLHRLIAQQQATTSNHSHYCVTSNDSNLNSNNNNNGSGSRNNDDNSSGGNMCVTRDGSTLAYWHAMLRHLLAHPAIDVNTGYAFTPLQSAVLAGNAGVVELLLLHPALRPNRITAAAHKLSNALPRLRHGTLTTSALCAAATPAISLAVHRRQVALFALLVRDRRVTLPVTLMAELEHNAADCGTAMYLEIVARYRRQWEFWQWTWRRRCLCVACLAATVLALCNVCIVLLYHSALGHVLYILLAGYGLGAAIALCVCGYAQLQRVSACPHLISLFHPPRPAARLGGSADTAEDATEMTIVDVDNDDARECGGRPARLATTDRTALPESFASTSRTLTGACCDLRRGVFVRLFRHLMPRATHYARLVCLWLVVCCPPLLPPAMELLCLYHILRLYRGCELAETDATAATTTPPNYGMGSATRRARLSFPTSHRDESYSHGTSGHARHGGISRSLLSALSTSGLVGGALEGGGGRGGDEDGACRPALLPSHPTRPPANRGGGGATSALSAASATLQSLQSLPCASAAQFYVHTHPAPSRPHSASTGMGANSGNNNNNITNNNNNNSCGAVVAHSADEETLSSFSTLPGTASLKKRSTMGYSMPSLGSAVHYPQQQPKYYTSSSLTMTGFTNGGSEVFGGASFMLGGCGGVPRASFGSQPLSAAVSGRPGGFALQPLHDPPDLTLRSLLYLAYEALLPSRLVVCVLCIVMHLYLLLPDALASQKGMTNGEEARDEDGYVVLTLLASCGLVASVTASAAMLIMRLVLARPATRSQQMDESPPYCCMLPEEIPAATMAFNRYL